MPPPLEARDYIGLGASPATPASSSSCSSSPAEVGAHLALRLGLPGSESPARAEAVDAALTLGPAPPRGGAKRGGVREEEEEEKGLGEVAAGAPRAANSEITGTDRSEQIVAQAFIIWTANVWTKFAVARWR
uniref:Uncharacterized protein n=1 Tax=Oryza punctata TaxID=4537 RepID=A0A0E0L5N1_ORYPU